MALWQTVVRMTDPVLGGTGTNTWHGRTDGAEETTADDLHGLGDVLQDFYGIVAHSMSDTCNVRYDGIWVGISSNEGESRQLPDWNVDGSQAGGEAPPGLCICVNWTSESGGRSGRGRTFLGPIALPVLQTNGSINNTSLAEIRDAARDLVIANSGLSDGALGVYSVKDDVLRDFTGYTVKDRFAMLRSRRD